MIATKTWESSVRNIVKIHLLFYGDIIRYTTKKTGYRHNKTGIDFIGMDKLPGKNGTISHGYDKNGEFYGRILGIIPSILLRPLSEKKKRKLIDQ